MVSRQIKVEEVKQNLRDNWLTEDLNADPGTHRRLFSNNIFTRTLSHLFGRGEQKSIPIRSTEAGGLIVVPNGQAFNFHHMTSRTMSDDDSDDFAYDPICGRVDLWVYDNDAKISFKAEAYPLEDYWTIPKNSFYSFDAKIDTFSIKNAVAGANTRFIVVGFSYEPPGE